MTEKLDRSHLVSFLGVLFLVLAVNLWMIGPYLLTLFFGGTLAMLSYPFQRRLLARGWGARSAAAMVTTLMLIVFIAPLSSFSILAVKQGIAMGRDLAGAEDFSPGAVTNALGKVPLIKTFFGDPEALNAWLKSNIQAAGLYASGAVLKLAKGIPEFLLQMLLAVIAFFFFLLDGERFTRWILGLSALDRRVQEELVESFQDMSVSTVLAGLASAASQGALIAAGYLALGIPGQYVAAGATFILAWIPVLGSIPASLAGMLYLYQQGSHAKMGGMAVVAVLAGNVDNVVHPLVLKGRAGMHPLVGLVSIFGGIGMFGILGVFIGPILTAMLISLLKIWPLIGKRYGIGVDGADGRRA